MTTHKMSDLRYLVKNEYFITCPPLPTDHFIQFCGDRGIKTSKNQLEQFEKLKIFFPIARVKYPKISYKIKYVDDRNRYQILGKLGDGKEWNGDIKEKYTHFWFEKKYAESWLDAGFLWEPSSQPFQAWKAYKDEKGDRQV